MKNLLISIVIILSGCQANNSEVSMVCNWVLYGSQEESFVFNLGQKEVYWVNENKRLPLLEVNEGRIVFEGVRSTLLVGDKQTKKDVPIKFIIDRVTGKLSIEKVNVPSGYNNLCVTQSKVI